MVIFKETIYINRDRLPSAGSIVIAKTPLGGGCDVMRIGKEKGDFEILGQFAHLEYAKIFAYALHKKEKTGKGIKALFGGHK